MQFPSRTGSPSVMLEPHDNSHRASEFAPVVRRRKLGVGIRVRSGQHSG